MNIEEAKTDLDTLRNEMEKLMLAYQTKHGLKVSCEVVHEIIKVADMVPEVHYPVVTLQASLT